MYIVLSWLFMKAFKRHKERRKIGISETAFLFYFARLFKWLLYMLLNIQAASFIFNFFSF